MSHIDDDRGSYPKLLDALDRLVDTITTIKDHQEDKHLVLVWDCPCCQVASEELAVFGHRQWLWHPGAYINWRYRWRLLVSPIMLLDEAQTPTYKF